MKSIHSIQNEILLKEKSHLILQAMQNYNQDEEYFEYPRFKTFQSGLYNQGFKPIFSLIEYEMQYFKTGYHIDNNDAYLIIKLPQQRYFNASYLIIKNELSFAIVYEKVMYILSSILIVVFIFSMFLLQSFARVFNKINESLDNFIKDSIHEINTPLSIISINIDLYNRKNESNKYMQRIKAAAKVLSTIYNDMDYLIKHDKVEHPAESINLLLFLNDRIDYFNEVARMKNTIIHSDLKECTLVYMNKKQLQRLIDNTISNAVKYSYENSVVEIRLYMKDQRCHMSFQDYGSGIKNIRKIFNRYYRENTEKGGLGLGLNIVKSIIDEANIELVIDSLPSQGTKFLYIFPRN